MIYKGYQIKPYEPFPSLWRLSPENRGGSIPVVLTSMFTSVATARAAIDSYVDRTTGDKRVRKTNTA